MAKKQKHQVFNDVAHVANTAGVLMMTAAATLGMVELPHHPNNKVAVPAQPVYEIVGHGGNFISELGQIRREREETHQHSSVFTVGQRTPGRTGRA